MHIFACCTYVARNILNNVTCWAGPFLETQ